MLNTEVKIAEIILVEPNLIKFNTRGLYPWISDG